MGGLVVRFRLQTCEPTAPVSDGGWQVGFGGNDRVAEVHQTRPEFFCCSPFVTILNRQHISSFINDFSRFIELDELEWPESHPAFAVEKEIKH